MKKKERLQLKFTRAVFLIVTITSLILAFITTITTKESEKTTTPGDLRLNLVEYQ